MTRGVRGGGDGGEGERRTEAERGVYIYIYIKTQKNGIVTEYVGGRWREMKS